MMLCFRDMTFCESDCTNVECRRCLTDEVRAAGRFWWGGEDVPICVSDFSASCPDYSPTQGEDHD